MLCIIVQYCVIFCDLCMFLSELSRQILNDLWFKFYDISLRLIGRLILWFNLQFEKRLVDWLTFGYSRNADSSDMGPTNNSSKLWFIKKQKLSDLPAFHFPTNIPQTKYKLNEGRREVMGVCVCTCMYLCVVCVCVYLDVCICVLCMYMCVYNWQKQIIKVRSWIINKNRKGNYM